MGGINQFLNIIFNFNSKKKKMVFLDKKFKKKVYQALNEMLGLGSFNARLLCKKFGFQQKCIVKDLDSFQLEQLKNYLLNNYTLNQALVSQMHGNVKKKIDLGTYEGKRHNLGYPVRGQRTLSNGKTQRNLHKFRFYYDSNLFSHVYFKNQRKSLKKKKIKRLSEINRNRNYYKFNNRKVQNLRKPAIVSKVQTKAKSVKPVIIQKKKINKDVSYLKKLEKIKAERQLQIDRKFKRD